MPVGHVRINDPKPNPNDNITFIRVLEDRPDSDQALKILEALAAQFKPIMKEWGFGVNSLIEYEWNTTFAGRNWNAGEVVEIVLRRRDGSFAPYQFLLYVMCHELAHIREMNHSWAFQKVNSQLRASLARLRAQNYYGDGFWSTGRSLQYPNAEVPAAETELATLTCGGANKKSRGQRRRRRAYGGDQQRERGSAVKLGTTGRQTAIARKAGGRVSKKNAFAGQGQVLSEDPAQSTFKRRAQAQKAIEARAAAAEARIAAEKRARAAEGRSLARAAGPSPTKKPKGEVKGEVDAGQRAAGPSPTPTKKPEIEIDLSDSDDEPEPEPDTEADEDAHDVGGGWETDEEDKTAVQLDEEEKRWLESDLRHWEETFADDGEDVKPVVEASDSAAKSKRKGQAELISSSSAAVTPSSLVASGSGSAKRPRKASPPAPLAATPRPTIEIDDLTPEERAWLEADANATPPVTSGSDVSSKRPRKATNSPPPPHLEIDDLTPEERAWLEADMAVKDTGVEDGCGGGGGGGNVAYMPMPVWMGGGPPLLPSSSLSSTRHRQGKNSSDVDMIVDDFSDEDEADKGSAHLGRSAAATSRPPAVRSFPRPKAKAGGQPMAARVPGKEKQQPGRGRTHDWSAHDGPETIIPPSLPKKAGASTTWSASSKEKQQGRGWTSAWDTDDGLETSLRPSLPKKKAKAPTTWSASTQFLPPSFAPTAPTSTSKSSYAKATSATAGLPPPTKSTKQTPKKLLKPDPPDFKPFSHADKVPSQQSSKATKLFTPAVPRPSSSQAPPFDVDRDHRKFALPTMTTHSTLASMMELYTAFPRSARSGPPKTKKQRFEPPSDPLQDFDLEVYAPRASRPTNPSKNKARPLSRPRPRQIPGTLSDKPYERGSDADISSSASSVCSIPPALQSGVFKLSADELAKVLKSLDLQCKYNERRAKKRKRRQESLSRTGPASASAFASTAASPVKKRKTVSSAAGGAMTEFAKPPANKPKPIPSSSSAVKACQSDRQSQPVRARKSSIGDPRSMDDILEEASSKQRAFIDQMEREGKMWRCGVCDFGNAAIMPTCEFCSIGSALAATQWLKPA